MEEVDIRSLPFLQKKGLEVVEMSSSLEPDALNPNDCFLYPVGPKGSWGFP